MKYQSKVKMNKKAEGFIEATKTMYFLISLFVFIFMLGGLFYTLNGLSTAPTHAQDQAYINVYQERFLSSSDCFAYRDIETGVTYSHVVDVSKYTEEVLNECYVPDDEGKFEFYFSLEYGGNKYDVRTENYRWPIKVYPVSVLIYDGGAFKRGTLTIRAGSLKERTNNG